MFSRLLIVACSGAVLFGKVAVASPLGIAPKSGSSVLLPTHSSTLGTKHTARDIMTDQTKKGEPYDAVDQELQADPSSGYVPSQYTESWITGPESTNFYTRLYPASSGDSDDAVASVVFVHGFQEHIERYDHVFNRVAREGKIDVFAFDQRGWGRTALDETHKSKSSSYGLTTRAQQMRDIEFFIKRESERTNGARPIFLWGHSMGGGEVLSFATSELPDIPSKQTISLLSGVIAGSPLIKETRPSAKVLRLVGKGLRAIVPGLPFPAKIPASYLSSDPKVVAEAEQDPLMKTYGTVGGINDMLAGGDWLAAEGYKNWPTNLPLYVLQGTGDKIVSYEATQKFFEGVVAKDKQFDSFDGAFHEVHNEPTHWKRDVDDVIHFMTERLTTTTTGAKL